MVFCVESSANHPSVIHSVVQQSVCSKEGTESHLQSPVHLKNYINRIGHMTADQQAEWTERQVQEWSQGPHKAPHPTSGFRLVANSGSMLGIPTRVPDYPYSAHNRKASADELEDWLKDHPRPRVPDGMMEQSVITCKDL